ncbi:MAG: hypothetical protein JW384_04138 [Nitrosomonadaceae bacterium]|nr:hypothetical protein [Nitrosomonadaceae bacterium]
MVVDWCARRILLRPKFCINYCLIRCRTADLLFTLGGRAYRFWPPPYREFPISIYIFGYYLDFIS